MKPRRIGLCQKYTTKLEEWQMKVSLILITTEALKDLAWISQTVYKLTGEEEWKDRSECYETELLAREVESA